MKIHRGIPKFRYIPALTSKGHLVMVTEASQLIHVNEDELGGFHAVFVTGYAFQSARDRFVKKVGREIALTRMESNLARGMIIPLHKEEINFQVLNDFGEIAVIYQYECVPQDLLSIVSDYAVGVSFMDAMDHRIYQISDELLTELCPEMFVDETED